MRLFLVPYSFFVFVAGGHAYPGASTAAKGPRSQPILSMVTVLIS